MSGISLTFSSVILKSGVVDLPVCPKLLLFGLLAGVLITAKYAL